MGEAPALVIACTMGRVDGQAGLIAASTMGNVLPAMWSFMLAARLTSRRGGMRIPYQDRLTPSPSMYLLPRTTRRISMSIAKTLSLSAVALCVAFALAPAQVEDIQPPPANGGAGGKVTVSGRGEVQAAPDMLTLMVEASNNDSKPAGASADTRKAMTGILAAARKSVGNPNDLRTTRISINPEYEWVEGKRKFRGYVASQSLEITLRDVSRLDSLLEHLNKASFTTLGNIAFGHSKADSLQREARALAIRDAAVNAASLCAAAGRSCDELLGARAGFSGGQGPAPMEFKAARMMAADAGTGMPVQPGLLTFSAEVEADYLLK
jgi:uncharacterized protein YggE